MTNRIELYKKLSQVQKRLFVEKGQTNSFGGYKYRSCEDILKTLKPICEDIGCLVFITNTMAEIGGRNYVGADVHFVDLETGEEIVSSAHAREEEAKKGMDGSQITGASSSYARKYALAGLFCIDNEKDSDATNNGEAPATREDAVKSAEARAKLLKYINDTKMTKENVEKICKYYKVSAIANMTYEQCEDYMKKLALNGGKHE